MAASDHANRSVHRHPRDAGTSIRRGGEVCRRRCVQAEMCAGARHTHVMRAEPHNAVERPDIHPLAVMCDGATWWDQHSGDGQRRAASCTGRVSRGSCGALRHHQHRHQSQTLWPHRCGGHWRARPCAVECEMRRLALCQQMRAKEACMGPDASVRCASSHRRASACADGGRVLSGGVGRQSESDHSDNDHSDNDSNKDVSSPRTGV